MTPVASIISRMAHAPVVTIGDMMISCSVKEVGEEEIPIISHIKKY